MGNTVAGRYKHSRAKIESSLKMGVLLFNSNGVLICPVMCNEIIKRVMICELRIQTLVTKYRIKAIFPYCCLLHFNKITA